MSERYVVGVDIGGTNLVVGVVPLEGGKPLGLRSGATRPDRGPDAAVADVVAMAEDAISEALDEVGGSRERIAGVGIGCPGCDASVFEEGMANQMRQLALPVANAQVDTGFAEVHRQELGMAVRKMQKSGVTQGCYVIHSVQG